MKSFIIALTILPLATFAQNCKLTKTTDPFTHETKLSTGFIPFDNGNLNLSISIDATANDVDFFFWLTSGTNCFDDQSTAQIIYDGERMKANFRNNGSMNCEGAFHLNFRNLATTPSALDRIATKKIKNIHLAGANKTIVDIALTEDQKQKLMELASCVIKEAKTLIKQ